MTEETIFTEAIANKSPAERAAYLAGACGGDGALRQRIEGLIASHEQTHFMARPALEAFDPLRTVVGSSEAGLAPQPDFVSLTEGPGTHIGRYKLLQQIGEGGFGVVFMAEQEQPVRRKVALKIIKLGMDTKSVVARFEAERQALAMMDHPNIAKVLDGGSTETGRPYFVMELVKGVPITAYCNDNRLSTKERLDLFIVVCGAVQHAHQKGIIHRDLKPSNVLVTMHDDKPMPMVIDFGIAKATQSRLTEKTMFTEFKQMIGTPAYMSPEQAQMSALDVDTRSDIYSLGVLLYELLTGTTPFDGRELLSLAYGEMQRVIKEVEPPKPSTRLSTLGEKALTALGGQRRTEGMQLSKMVRGDLDWIVMKCLEKDRTRRYETANGLAKDIGRYLGDEPVEASPPSATYRLRKLAYKYRMFLRVAAAFAFLLIGATVFSILLATRATRAEADARRDRDAAVAAQAALIEERDRAVAETKRADQEAAIANAVNGFLNNDILGQADTSRQVGGNASTYDLTVREALDRAANRIAGRFDKQPLVEAAIRRTIGDAYRSLLDEQKALPQTERALQLISQARGPDDLDTLRLTQTMGLIYGGLHQYDKSEEFFQKAIDGWRRIRGDGDATMLYAEENLAYTYGQEKHYEKAAALLEQILQQMRTLPGGENKRETLTAAYLLGNDYMLMGRYDQAEPLLVRTLHEMQSLLGDLNAQTLATQLDLGKVYTEMGRLDEAQAVLLSCLNGCRKVFGDLHARTRLAASALAAVYAKLGQNELAGALLIDPSAPSTRPGLVQPAKGEANLLELIKTQTATLGPDDSKTLASQTRLAAYYHAQHDDAKAEELYLQVLRSKSATFAEKKMSTTATLVALGDIYLAQNIKDKPIALFQQDIDLKRKVLGDQDPAMFYAMENLGWLYSRQGDPDKAEPLLKQALAGLLGTVGEKNIFTITTEGELGYLYENKGDLEKAMPLYEKAFEASRTMASQGDRTRALQTSLVRTYRKLGLTEKANALQPPVAGTRPAATQPAGSVAVPASR